MHPEGIREKQINTRETSRLKLSKILKSVETLYTDVFREEGNATLLFDITSFPPAMLPENCLSFQANLSGGEVLEDFQKKILRPYMYNKKPYYLLGEVKSDADQLTTALPEIEMINPEYKTLSALCMPQDMDYYHGRLPFVSVHAVCNEDARITFSLIEDQFEHIEHVERVFSKQMQMDALLGVAEDSFMAIYRGKRPVVPAKLWSALHADEVIKEYSQKYLRVAAAKLLDKGLKKIGSL